MCSKYCVCMCSIYFLGPYYLKSYIYRSLNVEHFPLLRAIAAEVCEELFVPTPPHSELALNGVEVFMNASGSHHQLRKLDLRLRAIIGATHTRGGVYMYSNHQGCDGGRLYYGIRKFS